MLALLLAAGAVVAHPAPKAAQPSRSIDQRLALLEARQLLESQALWSVQASLPTDTLKALSNLDLHLLRDQEQEEQVKSLQTQVHDLEQRLQTVEILLSERTTVSEGAIRVAPHAAATPAPAPIPVVSQPLVLNGKPKPTKSQAKQPPKPKATHYAER